jgi:Bacterial archaeo-eukaryotic release factor family 2
MHLHRIRPVVEHDGPFLSLHVEVGRTTEDAAQQRDARWTSIRHELERLQLADALINDVRERLDQNTHVSGEARRTLVLAGGEVVFDDVQPGSSNWPETVQHAPLPDLAGWLTAADQELPFVLVVADRTGADIEVHRAAASPPTAQETVTGETFYITKVAEGDWAQKQFQQTAENTWHENAKLVSEAVRSLERSHRPRVIFVAGDVRARSEISKLLESGGSGPTILTVESGGRADGASEDALWKEIRQHLAGLQGEQDADLAGLLDEARGRGEGAVHGLEEVANALAQARVDRLVLDLGRAREHLMSAAAYEGLPVPAAARDAEVPADGILVAAAALTDASLSLLPAGMGRGGGISALLRWTT